MFHRLPGAQQRRRRGLRGTLDFRIGDARSSLSRRLWDAIGERGPPFAKFRTADLHIVLDGRTDPAVCNFRCFPGRAPQPRPARRTTSPPNTHPPLYRSIAATHYPVPSCHPPRIAVSMLSFNRLCRKSPTHAGVFSGSPRNGVVAVQPAGWSDGLDAGKMPEACSRPSSM